MAASSQVWSPDGSFYWDATAWRQPSADGRHYFDGYAWQEIPQQAVADRPRAMTTIPQPPNTVSLVQAPALQAVAPSPSAPGVVRTTQKSNETTVTLIPIDQLETKAASAASECSELQARATAVRASGEEKSAAAGAALVESQADWHGSAQDSEVISSANALINQIRADEGSLSELDQHRPTGIKRLLEPLTKNARDRARLSVDKTQASAKLRPILIQLAGQAPPTTVPAADDLRSAAAALRVEATSIEQSIESRQVDLREMNDEVSQRQEFTKKYGFDLLLIQATLEKYGPTPVDSPVVLKKGEIAYLSWPAALARHVTRTTYVGGSQGMSFPVGHTGIRYRVGSFRGHPVAEDSIKHIDTGTLVLTNQRLVYIGTAKSVSTPLPKVLHVEVYTDGLGVFQEGREAPNIYVIETPGQFMLYMNFLLNRLAAAAP